MKQQTKDKIVAKAIDFIKKTTLHKNYRMGAAIIEELKLLMIHPKELVLKREPTAYLEGVKGKYYMVLAHYGEKVLGVSLSSEEAAWFNAYNNQSEEEKGLLLNKIKDL